MYKKTYLLNSILFVPAIVQRFYKKILTLEGNDKPDCIIFDLEDSIDDSYKDKARSVLIKYMENQEYREKIFQKYVVIIRINRFDSPWYTQDLELINKIHPDYIMLSKVESSEEIKETRLKTGQRLLIAVETLKGIDSLESIVSTIEKQDVFVLGYEDLSAELGIERPTNLNTINPLTHIILNAVVIARKHKVVMLDAVCRYFLTNENLSILHEECKFALSLGFSGKIAIHPSQISTINAIFDADKLIKNAQYILGKFNEIENGTAVIVGDTHFTMDKPSLLQSEKIIKSLV